MGTSFCWITCGSKGFPRGGSSACRSTSLCETDSPDTGEVALAPEGERCPEGAEGENLAIARNASDCRGEKRCQFHYSYIERKSFTKYGSRKARLAHWIRIRVLSGLFQNFFRINHMGKIQIKVIQLDKLGKIRHTALIQIYISSQS